MKVIKYGAIALLVLVLLGIGGLFFLGIQSQNGSAFGLVEGRLSPCPSSPNCVSSEAGEPGDKAVPPLPVEAWANLPKAIVDMGGKVTAQEEAYLSAEFTSGVFRFVDDVEFRLTEADIHLRSASRVGYSDAGANSARVAELRAQLTR
ncbi:MAG: DUF1499 domain-containing protein [Pseudomonadota bacterium]